ncbi:MAG: response regulator transcription factor, partial [Alphaproteobacteria bacterium]
MKGKIRVAVVVDLPLLREGIVHALSNAKNIVVVAGTQPGLEGLTRSRLSVDILIVELTTTAGSFQFIEKVSEQHPGTSILLLGEAGDPRAVISALKGGARGYVLTSVSGSDLIEAVRQLALGESYVSPNLAAQLLGASIIE